MRRTLPLVVLFATLASGAALAAGPDPHIQPLVDGCQRNNTQILTLSTPEWAYVDRLGTLQQRAVGNNRAGQAHVQGVVTNVHPAGDDLFFNHDFNDLTFGVRPQDDLNLTSQISNALPEIGSTDIGIEWEEALMPTWAWPSIEDRVVVSGSYIWDCGHWGNSAADPTGLSQFVPYDPIETGRDIAAIAQGNPNGAIRGEQTEVHPPYEVAVFRKDAAAELHGQGRPVSRLDAWISGDGGWALAEEECALLGVPPAGHRACSRFRDVSGTYSYRLALPSCNACGSIRWNPPVIHSETDVALQATNVNVVPNPVDGSVQVSFTIPPIANPTEVAQHLGVTVEAGWSNDPTPVVKHHVELTSMHIQKSLDTTSEPSQNPVNNGPEQTPGPGEWVMFASANGHWVQLPPASLTAVTDDQTIPLAISFDYWTPQSVPARLFVSGRECDIPLMDCTHDYWGGQANPALSTEVGYNDHPGRIRDRTQSKNIGKIVPYGQFTFAPAANPSTNPGNGNEDQSDFTCGPAGCYQLTGYHSAIA